MQRHAPAGSVAARSAILHPVVRSFSDGVEAAAAVANIEADYPRHQRAAREVAAEHFDAGRVLSRILESVGLA